MGLAVAKAPRALALRPSGERWAVPNDASGVATLVDRLQVLHPTLLGLEATGGLERLGTSAWATAGLPVVVVPPRQARAFARATGQLAKPDAGDARALAHVADVMRPTPRPLPDTQTQALRALLGRRQPLVVMRTAAQHRLAGTRGRLQTDSEAQSTGLHAPRALLDDDLATLLRASPLWRENEALWQSAPGIGPVCARPLWWELPAWGTLTRPQSAALVGGAPLKCASGTLRGRRMIWGGRAHGRTGLAMGPLGATRDHPRIKAFYARLLAAGQVKKVALTACRPKFLTILNAMLQQRTPWQAQESQG